MIGTSVHVTAKLQELYDAVHFDRVQALVDWGGMPPDLVTESVFRLATEIAPAVRRHAEAHTLTPAS